MRLYAYAVTVLACCTFIAAPLSAKEPERDQIRAVGSSTVFPFASAAAEQYAQGSSHKTPIVESTGTGGGIKLFCSGVGIDTPDIVNASRRITAAEMDTCASNGVSDLSEVKIGYDGIVIADARNAKPLAVSREQLFLALARRVPQQGKLVDNPYVKWSEIDPALPELPIEVYGPPPSSGTRDAFVELVMEKSCEHMEAFKALPSADARKAACKQIREDGRFIEVGENDNIIAQKLKGNEKAFGIFGYSFLEQNQDSLKAAEIDGIAPSFENISEGAYPLSRPLYVYVKLAHVGKVTGLKEFVNELISDGASGDGGYLIEKGLIPLHAKERPDVLKAAQNLDKLKL